MNAPLAFGLFGKLPARRDFVAQGLPQAALEGWENWLQHEIAQSRQLLGRAFLEVYLHAPIWRFWCGPAVLGRAALGIVMPSVDGVGRYFPLTLLAFAPQGQDFIAPFSCEVAQSFAVLEALALGALEPAADYPRLLAALRAVPVPATAPEAVECAPFRAPPADDDLAAPAVREQAGPTSFEPAHSSPANASRWWTTGGDGFAPTLRVFAGLPQGVHFAGLLTKDAEAVP